MTESEPTEIPRFAHSVFGYDRYQVEEYLGRLREWAMEAQERTNEAVRLATAREEEIRALRVQIGQQAEDSATPADRMGAVLVQAFDDLQELRRRAGENAERSFEMARTEALDMVRTAREMAEKLVAEAEQDRVAANVEHQAARVELEAAKAERDTARSDADRILAAAEAEATQIRRRAEEMHHGARQEQQLMEESLSALPDDLQRIVGSLDRLNQRLRGLSFEATTAGGGPAD